MFDCGSSVLDVAAVARLENFHEKISKKSVSG